MHEHHVVSDHNGALLSRSLRCCCFCIQHGYRAKCVCPLVSHARQAHLIIQLFISIFAIDEDEKRLLIWDTTFVRRLALSSFPLTAQEWQNCLDEKLMQAAGNRDMALFGTIQRYERGIAVYISSAIFTG